MFYKVEVSMYRVYRKSIDEWSCEAQHYHCVAVRAWDRIILFCENWLQHPTQYSDLLLEAAPLMLFPYGIIMNCLTTLNHHDFWSNRTTQSTSTLRWKPSAKVMMWQSHTAVCKVHQNPGVSLCPSIAFLPPSYHEAIFLNIPAGEKHCLALGGQGGTPEEKKNNR